MSYLSCFLALNILMILDEGLEDLLPVDAPLELLRVHLGNLLEKGRGCRTYSYCGFKGHSFVPQFITSAQTCRKKRYVYAY
jgi:hypothetical protein